jgi:hypothetical protein
MWFVEKLVNSSKKNPRFSICCSNGSVKLDPIKPPDNYILNLISNNDKKSKEFRNQIRLYNSILAFTYMSCKVDEKLLTKDRGTYTLRINGSVHHNLSNFLPEKNDHTFSHIYIMDPNCQLDRRNKLYPNLDKDILKNLQEILHKNNPFVKLYRQVGERLKTEPATDIKIVLKNNYKKDKRYNVPTANEIAVLMIDDENKSNERDIVIEAKCEINQNNYSKKFTRINEYFNIYDPLQYVLMFQHGDFGWHPQSIPLIKKIKENCSLHNTSNENLESNSDSTNKSSKKMRFVTAMQYYSYRLHDRKGKNKSYTSYKS